MTLVQFAEVYAVLSAQLQHPDVDPPFVRAYFKAVSDLEVEFVAMAADRFAAGAAVGDDGKAWFPKAPEWRALALKIEREREEAVRAHLRQASSPLCLACDDTGWRRTLLDNVLRCECRALRRLEVLGRRPMPQLPPAPEGA